jgi:CheY-like chemotaxis protein
MTPHSLAGVSILLVEDDPDGREVLETFLTYIGATVQSASTAEEGLERFKAAVPAIVITDIVLPGHDGLWLLGQIRALAVGARIPVIALTGRVLPSDIQRVRAAGFDTHLAKPVDLDDITDAVTRLTAR